MAAVMILGPIFEADLAEDNMGIALDAARMAHA